MNNKLTTKSVIATFSFLTLITSCTINRSITIATSAQVNSPNFKIIKNVTGLGKSTREAKLNLYENAKLTNNQIIGNVTLDQDYTYFFSFLVGTKVIMNADIIEFYSVTNENVPSVNTTIQKSIEAKITEKEVLISVDEKRINETKNGKYFMFTNTTIDDFKKDDCVKFTSQFGDDIYGLVMEKINSKRLKIKYFTPSHDALTTELDFKDLHKIALKP